MCSLRPYLIVGVQFYYLKYSDSALITANQSSKESIC